MGFPDGSDGKEPSCNWGHPGLIPELGRSLGEGNSNPLQNSCLEISTDRGVWQATIGSQRVRHNLAINTHIHTHTHTSHLYYTKAIYRFNAIPIKIFLLFAEIEKSILGIIWNLSWFWTIKITLKKKNKVGGLTLPDFKTYYKAAVIQKVWYWHNDRLGSLFNKWSWEKLKVHMQKN